MQLDFDQDEKLIDYRKLPRNWQSNGYEEDLLLKELGENGDPIAKRLWEQSRTYYTSQDKEVIKERIAKEKEHTATQSRASLELKQRAESGDAEAQYQLFLISGRKSIKWLCQSADQGNINARLELAYLYRSGAYGFPQDYKRSYVWYRLAASGEQRKEIDALILKLKRKHSLWNPIICSKGQSCYIAKEIVQLEGLLRAAGIMEAEQILLSRQPGECERSLARTENIE